MGVVPLLWLVACSFRGPGDFYPVREGSGSEYNHRKRKTISIDVTVRLIEER